ncbi:NYN domain-containing protein [Salmonella enterica]|nr:NYN domain-containing protein [Salmonella enterica]
MDISILEPLLKDISLFWDVSVKRIYSSGGEGTEWKSILKNNSIKIVHQYENVGDSSLVIEAMDLLYSQKIDCFCLVSNDKDFTNLAIRLKEEGLTVIGYGGIKTPKSYRNACNHFVQIETTESTLIHELKGMEKVNNIYITQDEIIKMCGSETQLKKILMWILYGSKKP